MKNIGTIAVGAEVLTLATCFRVERRDGTIFRFTDHDQDLVVDGETYSASTGYTRTANTQNADMSVDDCSVEGVLSSDAITEHEMRTGVWDYAAVQIFAVDWTSLAAGRIRMKKGRLGEISCDQDGKFQTELRGLTEYLSQTLGEVYSPECRAMLGDSRCKVDLTPFTFTGTITAVTLSDTFVTDISQAAGYFNGGVLEFTSGLNSGVRREVLSYSGGGFWLFPQPPTTPSIGDTVKAVVGCDHTRETCINQFNNIVNYRGEPFVPGDDWLWSNVAEFS